MNIAIDALVEGLVYDLDNFASVTTRNDKLVTRNLPEDEVKDFILGLAGFNVEKYSSEIAQSEIEAVSNDKMDFLYGERYTSRDLFYRLKDAFGIAYNILDVSANYSAY